jgi:hypothetical protein
MNENLNSILQDDDDLIGAEQEQTTAETVESTSNYSCFDELTHQPIKLVGRLT